MAVCVRVTYAGSTGLGPPNATNYVLDEPGVMPPNPQHAKFLVLDPEARDVSTCQYVVQTGAEVANSLFSLTASEGALLSGGVVGCWAAAYVIRAVINVIKGSIDS